MAKQTKKKEFHYNRSRDLKADSRGKEVDKLQDYLINFGYLRGSFKPSTVCPCTERAIRRYQRYYELKVDGVVGPITKEHMEQPRCGVPDIGTIPAGTAAPFVLRGCSYDRNRLTYAFLNGTPDLPGTREQDIVRQAFDAWAAVTDLKFVEVSPADGPDFRIAWRSGNHGDGSSFDGAGNTLAHAFFPPPCGGPNAGDLHFDEDERYIDDPAAQGILLLQVAIHEIGHLLGLSHSQDEDAIMFAFYSPDRTNLSQDDINGIQALYGPPTAQVDLPLEAGAEGNLSRGGDTQEFVVEVPQTLAISIDGPGDADFDLYVRKDAAPTVDEFDFRAFTASSAERILVPVEQGSRYFVMVRSFEGSGDYKLTVEPGVVQQGG